MSRKREMQRHLAELHNIRNVMGALKNLAVLETHKLARNLENSRQMTRELEQIGADLAIFIKDPQPGTCASPLYLVLGAERGFCGEFNEALLLHLETLQPPPGSTAADLIVVGQKLASRLDGNSRVLRVLDGPTVADDVDLVLGELVSCLQELSNERRDLRVVAVFHDPDQHGIQQCELLPNALPPSVIEAPAPALAPLLNLPAAAVLQALLEHYLFTRLHDIAFQSLTAENHYRIQHLTGALRKLDDAGSDLTRRYHVQRQEEITEEIEVILLNGAIGG